MKFFVIKYFRFQFTFYEKAAPPPSLEKPPPVFSSNPLSKLRSCQATSLFKNFVGESPPPPTPARGLGGGGVHTIASTTQFVIKSTPKYVRKIACHIPAKRYLFKVVFCQVSIKINSAKFLFLNKLFINFDFPIVNVSLFCQHCFAYGPCYKYYVIPVLNNYLVF